MQLYFDKITELVVSKSSSILFKKALVSLATDSGLHPLVPYFTCFIADEVYMFEHRRSKDSIKCYDFSILVCLLFSHDRLHVDSVIIPFFLL